MSIVASFGLVGKLFSKGDITGFFIIDETGHQMLISKDKTIQLVETGSVANWRVVTDEDGEKHLIGDEITLSDLPTMVKDNINQLTLITRITKEGKTVGFSCVDTDGTKRNYTVEKLWELAKAGKVKGVQFYKSNDSRVLLSDHQELRNLQTVNM